jgi:protein SCO1
MKTFVILCLTFLTAQAAAHQHSAVEMATPSTDSIFNLSSTWIDQSGKSFRLDSLNGSPSVIAMAYTSCRSSCPLIVEEMRKIETDLSKLSKKPVHFFIFSFDSKRDTPQSLKAFAQKRKLDLNHWTLLHGDAKAIQDLAAVLGIRYKVDSNGDFAHSNVITLVDSEGVVKNQLNGIGQDPEEMEKQLVQIQTSISAR